MVALLRFCAAALLATVGDGASLRARIFTPVVQPHRNGQKLAIDVSDKQQVTVSAHNPMNQDRLIVSLLQAHTNNQVSENQSSDEEKKVSENYNEADDYSKLMQFFDDIKKVRETASSIKSMEADTTADHKAGTLSADYLEARTKNVNDMPQTIDTVIKSGDEVYSMFIGVEVKLSEDETEGKTEVETCREYKFPNDRPEKCRNFKNVRQRMDMEVASLSIEMGKYLVGITSDIDKALEEFILAASQYGLLALELMQRCDYSVKNETNYYNSCTGFWHATQRAESVYQSKLYEDFDEINPLTPLRYDPGNRLTRHARHQALQASILASDKKRSFVQTTSYRADNKDAQSSGAKLSLVYANSDNGPVDMSRVVLESLKSIGLARMAGYDFFQSAYVEGEIHFNHSCSRFNVDENAKREQELKTLNILKDFVLSATGMDEQHANSASSAYFSHAMEGKYRDLLGVVSYAENVATVVKLMDKIESFFKLYTLPTSDYLRQIDFTYKGTDSEDFDYLRECVPMRATWNIVAETEDAHREPGRKRDDNSRVEKTSDGSEDASPYDAVCKPNNLADRLRTVKLLRDKISPNTQKEEEQPVDQEEEEDQDETQEDGEDGEEGKE